MGLMDFLKGTKAAEPVPSLELDNKATEICPEDVAKLDEALTSLKGAALVRADNSRDELVQGATEKMIASAGDDVDAAQQAIVEQLKAAGVSDADVVSTFTETLEAVDRHATQVVRQKHGLSR